MERITLLDTSIGSTNKGDNIIVQCVKEELAPLLKKYYTLYTPTHLSAFRAIECVGRLPDSANEIYQSKYKFVCGTNLLSGKMLHRTNQWNINYFNSKPIEGCILLGVGGGGDLDFYTRQLYKKILSHNFIHSVREEKTLIMMRKMGFQCVNTGCVTMWRLSPEFCRNIPTTQSDRVVFTLTDYNKNVDSDRQLLEMLRNNYSELNFWIQGIHDLEYLQSLGETKDINILNAEVEAYEKILGEDVDYVGTRLHAGIFAMRHGKRSIILRVDERMNAMSGYMPNNCLSRFDMNAIEKKIKGDFLTEVNLDWETISKWKEQFD